MTIENKRNSSLAKAFNYICKLRSFSDIYVTSKILLILVTIVLIESSF